MATHQERLHQIDESIADLSANNPGGYAHDTLYLAQTFVHPEHADGETRVCVHRDISAQDPMYIRVMPFGVGAEWYQAVWDSGPSDTMHELYCAWVMALIRDGWTLVTPELEAAPAEEQTAL